MYRHAEAMERTLVSSNLFGCRFISEDPSRLYGLLLLALLSLKASYYSLEEISAIGCLILFFVSTLSVIIACYVREP